LFTAGPTFTASMRLPVPLKSNDGDELGGGDVVAGRELGHPVEVEGLGDVLGR
jgi:hypothetical protein